MSTVTDNEHKGDDKMTAHEPRVRVVRTRISEAVAQGFRFMRRYTPKPLTRLADAFSRRMPKGLYARALIIIIAPMLILETVIGIVVMDRHWETVTRRLSSAVVNDIAMLITVYESTQNEKFRNQIVQTARTKLHFGVTITKNAELPPPGAKPFFSLLDKTLSREISAKIGKPFWIDTLGRSQFVDIRVKVGDDVLQVIVRQSQAYASKSYLFIAWMLSTALLLIIVAILFMHNQIKPIQQLARAAEAFGKGRGISRDFRPRGAREVRQAGRAFIEMGRRIERQIEQRTTMLAGVSHDLRTVLTRFRLQLALLEDRPEAAEMGADIDEMQAMLDDYMAFAKGDAGEEAVMINIRRVLDEACAETRHSGKSVNVASPVDMPVRLRRHAFKRAVANLVNNAAKFADTIVVRARRKDGWLQVTIDDDGPGIPKEERERVFRPFQRLDDARNQDVKGTGLGLSIARDIARTHGGDITLENSELGGLRAVIQIPV